MKTEPLIAKASQKTTSTSTSTFRWTAALLATIVGVVNLYYGNSYAGFYENLWYVMGGIYILAAVLLAVNELPHFVQPAVFGYALFLISLWAVGAATTGAGLDIVAYLDKAIEAIFAINVALLIRDSRAAMSWR